MRHARSSTGGWPLRGLTLIEVIVVLIILLVLLSFVVPATNRSRGIARRMMCENNMRNVSTAFHAFATANGGSLPALRGPLMERDADPANALEYSGWPVQVLPYLEQQGLYRAVLACTADGNRDPDNRDDFAALSRIRLPIFTCPDSARADEPGALSFAANMGYMTADIWDDPSQGHRHRVSGTYNWNNGPFDENSPEDEAVSRATGVILHDPAGRGVKIDAARDGASHTLLLAENLNAGWWVSGSPHETGFAVCIAGTASVIPTAAASPQGLGAGTQVSALELAYGGSRGTIDLGHSVINSKRYSNQRDIPRPSSVHAGVVNVFFCDGHGRSLSDKIDPGVYARLVTSAGGRHGQAKGEEDF